MAKDKQKSKIWVIYGEEELPLGLAVAETAGGAKAVYEKRTGKTRDGIHVEDVTFTKQFFRFTPLI